MIKSLSSGNSSSRTSNKMSSSYRNKENIDNYATKAPTNGNGRHSADQHAASASQRVHKLRPSKKNSKESGECEPIHHANACASSDRPVNRAPIDPPGHLGAMPWMSDSYNVYQGNAPTFATMASWAFQPMPPVHGWGMPPFLAPLAGAVRHPPFANFSQPQPSGQHYEPKEEDVSESFDADEAVDAEDLSICRLLLLLMMWSRISDPDVSLRIWPIQLHHPSPSR